VGGCLAPEDRAEIVRAAPWVDVVFGTHNIGSCPRCWSAPGATRTAQVEIKESLEVFPSSLPARRELGLRGLGVHLGGLQQHLHVLHRALAARHRGGRRPGDVLAEVSALAAEACWR